MPNYVQSSPTNPLISLSRGAVGYSFGTQTSVAIAASPTGLVRAQNVITVTTSVAHKFIQGQIVVLRNTSGVLGTAFDGTYIIQTIPLSTTLTIVPIDPSLLHLPNDTGGAGTALSLAGEQPAVIQAGQAFALQPSGGDSSLPLSADGVFSGAPGAFEVDLQVADFDADPMYQTVGSGNITSVDATNNTFHIDATTTNARFARLLLRSRANAVNLIAGFKR
jgi:hypothetical protein